MFETPGQPCPGGGITLVKKAEFVPFKGKGGVMLYLYVADLEGWEEVCLHYILILLRGGFMRVNVFVLSFWDINKQDCSSSAILYLFLTLTCFHLSPDSSFSIDQLFLSLIFNHTSSHPQKITSAGGRKTTEVESDENAALMQHFKDTEESWVGLYTMKKQDAKQ